MSVRTNDMSPSVCSPIRKHDTPWHHGMVTHHWDYFIIVSHLTCRSFPSLYPLKLNSGVVSNACSPTNQNTLTKQPCGPYIQCCTDQASPYQMPMDFTSVCAPLPAHRKTHYKAPLKIPRYIPEWWVPYVPAETDKAGRQTSHLRLHHSCPELQSWAPGSRSVKCGENRNSRGKHVSTGQL